MASHLSESDEFIPYSAAWDQAELRQVLRDLDRMAERSAAKQFEGVRRHERHPYTGMVAIRQVKAGGRRSGLRADVTIVGRNLSQSGLGALAPMHFVSEYATKDMSALPALELFRDEALLEVGLKQECGKSLWLVAAVVRARIVQHDFLDVGLKFRGRLNVDVFCNE